MPNLPKFTQIYPNFTQKYPKSPKIFRLAPKLVHKKNSIFSFGFFKRRSSETHSTSNGSIITKTTTTTTITSSERVISSQKDAVCISDSKSLKFHLNLFASLIPIVSLNSIFFFLVLLFNSASTNHTQIDIGITRFV